MQQSTRSLKNEFKRGALCRGRTGSSRFGISGARHFYALAAPASGLRLCMGIEFARLDGDFGMGLVGDALFAHTAQDDYPLDDGMDSGYHLDHVACSDRRDICLVYRGRFHLERVDPCAHGRTYANGRAYFSSLQAAQAGETA